MQAELKRDLSALSRMTVLELREKYRLVTGKENLSRHCEYLRKRVAWELQARAEGGISERARQRALEIANNVYLRSRMPVPLPPPNAPERTVVHSFGGGRDKRLPLPGTLIVRTYRRRTIRVTVLDNGFEYEGERFRSLTSVAQKVTGAHWNGMLFFGLGKEAA